MATAYQIADTLFDVWVSYKRQIATRVTKLTVLRAEWHDVVTPVLAEALAKQRESIIDDQKERE